MKIDIWTIVFQIINFLILLFILKRLLYRPVREIMQKRKDMVEKSIRDAEEQKEKAEHLRKQCQQERDRLKNSRDEMLEQAKADAEKEKEALIEEARRKAEGIMEKERALIEREKEKLLAELRDSVYEAVADFSRNLLADVTDGDLHEAIYRRFSSELDGLVKEAKESGRKDPEVTVEIQSAYEMSNDEAARLVKRLKEELSKEVHIRISVEPALIAGVKATVYNTVFDYTLAGQVERLKFRLRESE